MGFRDVLMRRSMLGAAVVALAMGTAGVEARADLIVDRPPGLGGTSVTGPTAVAIRAGGRSDSIDLRIFAAIPDSSIVLPDLAVTLGAEPATAIGATLSSSPAEREQDHRLGGIDLSGGFTLSRGTTMTSLDGPGAPQSRIAFQAMAMSAPPPPSPAVVAPAAAPVPEPSTLAMLAIGAVGPLGIALLRRSRRR